MTIVPNILINFEKCYILENVSIYLEIPLIFLFRIADILREDR